MEGKAGRKRNLLALILENTHGDSLYLEANLAPGSYNLASMASGGGKTQPELRYENRRGYAHNGWKDHSVNIKAV